MSEFGKQASFTPQEVLKDPSKVLALYDGCVLAALVEAARYITDILTAPDPMLGRSGAVCPFVGMALRSDMITLAVLPSRTADAAALRKTALAIKDQFRPTIGLAASAAENLRAVIIVMPYVETREAAHLVEIIQKDLKPEMIASGLMIGEFYPGCTLPGLNNPMFRPADTRFACLAIRRMTAGDLPFLIENADFVSAYLTKFGDEGRRRLRQMQQSASSTDEDMLQAGVVARSAMLKAGGGCPVHAG